MAHLDWLARRFPSALVRGANDAGWTPDVISYLTKASSQPQKMEIALQLWNGRVDNSCAIANPRSKLRCLTSSVYPYLQTPLFVQMSQYDSVFLSGIGVQPPFDPTETFLATLFASAVRDSLQPVGGAFSPRTHTHAVLPHPNFNSLKVDGYSARDLLGNWFFGRPGLVKVIKR
jgi:hypothetical protein